MENLDFTQPSASPVYDPAGFALDPHVQGRGVLVEVEDPELGPVPMHAPFPRLSRTPGRIRRLAPTLGQDEPALPRLAELGEAGEGGR